MELTHKAIGVLCMVLDMMAAFQAMVAAHYKLALLGFGAFVLMLIAGLAIYFSEKPEE